MQQDLPRANLHQMKQKRLLINVPHLKQEAHGSHRSPEDQFLVTFYFMVYAISVLNSEPLSGALVLVRGLLLALTI